MRARAKRDGVAEVFEQDRVTRVLQEALDQRYTSAFSTFPTAKESSNDAARGSVEATPNGVPLPRLTCPQHFTVRAFSRTWRFLPRFPHANHRCTVASPAEVSGDRSVAEWSTRWERGSPRWDAGARLAAAVIAECWRHSAFTALHEKDLRHECGLPEAVGSPAVAPANDDDDNDSGGLQGGRGAVTQRTDSSCTGGAVASLSGSPASSAIERATPLPAGLVTWQMFYELPPRWVMQSLGEVDQCTFVREADWEHRRRVTMLDVGATVLKRRIGGPPPPPAPPLQQSGKEGMFHGGDRSNSRSSSSSAVATAEGEGKRYRVCATAAMTRGEYWVDVVPLVDSSEGDGQCEDCESEMTGSGCTSGLTDKVAQSLPDSSKGTSLVERVDRDEVLLDPPLPLWVDPLLPCDELYSDRGVSTSTFVFFLRALQQQEMKRGRQQDARRGEIGGGRSHHLTLRGGSGGVDKRSLWSKAAVHEAHKTAATLAVELSLCARHRREALGRRIRALCATLPKDEAASLDEPRVAAGAVGAFSPSSRDTCVVPLVLLQIHFDTTRDCLQLRALKLRDRRRKRGREREDVRGVAEERDDGGVCVEYISPGVEVLRRSAEKLAALYDMTRAAALVPEVSAGDSGFSSDDEGIQQGTASATDGVYPLATAFLSQFFAFELTPSVEHGGGCPALPTKVTTSSPPTPWMTVVLPAEEVDGPSTPPPPFPRALSIVTAAPEYTEMATTAEERAFLTRLFLLLLRYRSLLGERGYNQGPQAAVPPSVMEELAATFGILAEAFASPLNAQLPQFGSLFPDTDAYFGSIGSFFDAEFGGEGAGGSGKGRGGGGGRGLPSLSAASSLRCPSSITTGCHVEVNPPFDTTLLRHMERHLLRSLARMQDSSQSLLFLVVLPSHDLTEAEREASVAVTGEVGEQVMPGLAYKPATTEQCLAGMADVSTVGVSTHESTERVLRGSPYCLAHVLCAAAESVYVDGHQHLLQSPFFCIETPTRMILLGNTAARHLFPQAADLLEGVRQSWRTLTLHTQKPKPVQGEEKGR